MLRSPDAILRVLRRAGRSLTLPRRGSEKAKLDSHICLEDET